MVWSVERGQSDSSGGRRQVEHITFLLPTGGLGLLPTGGLGQLGFRSPVGVQREPFIGVMVRDGGAVEVDMVVAVGTLGEVVIVKRTDDGQNQRE